MKAKQSCFLFLSFISVYIFLHKRISVEYSLLFLILYKQSLQDIKTLEVADSSMFCLLCVCLIIAWMKHASFVWIVLGACSASGVCALLYFMTKAQGIGGADVKFMFCCGSVLGFYGAFQCLFYACMLALCFHLCTHFQYSKIPFIPFLAMGVYLSLM